MRGSKGPARHDSGRGAGITGVVGRNGKSPVEQLRWVLDFAQRDLTAAKKEERGAVEDELLMITFRRGIISREGHVCPGPDLTRKSLLDLQREVRSGITKALSSEGWAVDGAGVTHIAQRF